MSRDRRRALLAALAACVAFAAAPATGSADVNYGPISHKGLKSAGAASTSLKLGLQVGLKANQSNIADAIKAASDPASSSYGTYPSLSQFQSRYGAAKSKRKGVKNAFAKQNVSASVDVTHLRVSATVTIGKAQKLFGTKWKLYKTGTSNELVALPVHTPKLPKGMAGNVDTVAGMRLVVKGGHAPEASAATHAHVGQAGHPPFDGGTPWRTGTPAPSCVATAFPGAAASGAGLFPNQITTAYGVAALRYAIVCSGGVQGCPGGGQSIAYVGGTSAATPLVAGMIALWTQQARATGRPRPGFVPPLLYSLARGQPPAFIDITQGGNALFGGSCCPARPGYDLATGWGSPLANLVAARL